MLRLSVGIAAIIEPLPQTVEVALRIDGVEERMFSLTFEGDPRSVLSIQAEWVAVSGRHSLEWIVDPFSRYDDPDRENNYVMFELEVLGPAETVTVTTTVVEGVTVTRTESVTVSFTERLVETITATSMRTETEVVTEAVEVLRERTETVTVSTTAYQAFTITERVTGVSGDTEEAGALGEFIKRLEGFALPGVLGGVGVVAGLLGFLAGRRLAPKLRGVLAEERKRVSDIAIFAASLLRPSREIEEGIWEAKPGELVPEASGIVTIDKQGNKSITYNNSCLYSSEIEKRPLKREDLEPMDRRVIEGLLDQLKSTRQTPVAESLELNDEQKLAIEELIQRFEEELERRERIK